MAPAKNKKFGKDKKVLYAVIAVLILIIIILIPQRAGIAPLQVEVDHFREELIRIDPSKLISYCDEQTSYSKDYCLFQAYLITLNDEAFSDGAFCESIENTSLQTSCYTGIATVWNATSLCDKLEDPDGRLTCITYSKKEVALVTKFQTLN